MGLDAAIYKYKLKTNSPLQLRKMELRKYNSFKNAEEYSKWSIEYNFYQEVLYTSDWCILKILLDFKDHQPIKTSAYGLGRIIEKDNLDFIYKNIKKAYQNGYENYSAEQIQNCCNFHSILEKLETIKSTTDFDTETLICIYSC